MRLPFLSPCALVVACVACSPDRGSVGSLASDGAGGTGTGSSTGAPSGITGGSGGSAGTTGGETTGGDSSGIRFDIPDGTDGQGEGCGCGNTEWSYIWVANALQSTLSKIDTRTMQEVGRFYTRPDRAGNPSRTSVSLSGNAVAVANRYGGVTKVWARDDLCDPMRNGVPGLQTSTSSTPLPWGEDDCVAWYTAFDPYTTQRPVAWAGGEQRSGSCEYQNEKVWTAGCTGVMDGVGGPGPLDVLRLDGDTGEVEAMTQIPNFCAGFGAYGGAVDGEGNLWLTPNGTGTGIARVDFETLDVRMTALTDPSFGKYGITVDFKGRPWVTSNNTGGTYGAARYDEDTDTWSYAEGFVSNGGIQQDRDGILWASLDRMDGVSRQGVVSIDPETLEVGPPIDVTGGSAKGISVDVDGFIWVITGQANKIEPMSRTVVSTYQGLSGPYTYSDMTGWGIQNSVCTPVG